MKKRFAIILTAAALSMTGCSLLGQDTYYIDQGMEQINSGNYEEALTSFSSAEQEGKHLVESYRGSGMAYMALGEYDKAVEAFDRAVDLTKEKQKDVRKDILMYKATALYQSGDYEGAAKVCDTIQTFGDSADAYYLQGLCYMELDEKDKAGVDFTTAVKLSPQDYDLLLNVMMTRIFPQRGMLIFSRLWQSTATILKISTRKREFIIFLAIMTMQRQS
mgnify:CR=1 FL=1